METNISNKCKAYTSLLQSKKLAKVLPHKTADNTYERVVISGCNLGIPEEQQYVYRDIPFTFFSGVGIPCWSLAALLDVLPLEVEIHKQTDRYKIHYYVESYMKRMGKEMYLSTERHDNLVDACVDMIEKLHELKLL